MIPLRSLPKHGDSQRAVPAGATWARIASLAPEVGVTRVADITGLDRVGIPTFSAIVPDSRDVLSVYNGKGSTRLAARIGAVMEAIERYSALHLQRPTLRGSYRDLARDHRVLHPRRLVLGMHPRWTESTPMDWVEGIDLLSLRSMWVPLQATALLHEPPPENGVYRYSTTNGLAAGNEPEEAICQALCELVERDAWTIAELDARYRPEALRKRANGGAETAPHGWVDDPDRFADLDLSGAWPRIERLVGRFSNAGLRVNVKDVTSDIGIATVLATVVEDEQTDAPLAHFGLGTHPVAEVAVARALTEVAQSRAVDIQGVREDITAAHTETGRFGGHTKRVERVRRASWYHLRSSAARRLDEVPSFRHGTVLEDVQLILDRLRNAGLRHVIAVDLTHPRIGVPVVRVLAPGLESWVADHGRLGWRAAAHWERWLGTGVQAREELA